MSQYAYSILTLANPDHVVVDSQCYYHRVAGCIHFLVDCSLALLSRDMASSQRHKTIAAHLQV